MIHTGLSSCAFLFASTQDFSKNWSDEELYLKYGLSPDEMNFIEDFIRPMLHDATNSIATPPPL